MKKIMIMLAFLMIVSGTASADQLLTNPGFESDYAGWTWPDSGVYVSTANPSAGSKHARSEWDFSLSQEVSIAGGGAYTISGDVFVPVGGGNGWSSWFNLKWLNASKVQIGANAWEVNPHMSTRGIYNSFASGSLTAPSDAAYAKVNLGVWTNSGQVTPANPIDWDNFALNGTPIPEPTSMLLLGSGLVGLFGVTRKKRS